MFSDSLYLYFNSTMVRLKDIKAFNDIMDKVFQFHYGTIKSYTNLSLPT